MYTVDKAEFNEFTGGLDRLVVEDNKMRVETQFLDTFLRVVAYEIYIPASEVTIYKILGGGA